MVSLLSHCFWRVLVGIAPPSPAWKADALFSCSTPIFSRLSIILTFLPLYIPAPSSSIFENGIVGTVNLQLLSIRYMYRSWKPGSFTQFLKSHFSQWWYAVMACLGSFVSGCIRNCVLIFISVKTNPLALYIVPSPHCVPSA